MRIRYVRPSGGAAASAAGEKPKLTFVAQIDNPSQGFSWKMYQKNADKYGFDVSVCDNKNDVQQQTTCINDAVAQGVKAIAINPKDEMGYVPADEGRHGGRRGRLPQHGATRCGSDRRLHLLGERG